MTVPFYTCGLAEDGCDEPFHELDRTLSQAGERELRVSGAQAAYSLFSLRLDKRSSTIPQPIPHECSSTTHHNMRLGVPHDHEHEKQCRQITSSWRSVELQERWPYACRLSDRMAQRLIEFHLGDIEALRDKISQKLRSHGDAVLRRWRKMSKDKKGRLLSAACPRVFDVWPVRTYACLDPSCHKKHLHWWRPGKWLSLTDFVEDWMKLVSVLHVRTAHDSAAWAAHDVRMGLTLDHRDHRDYFVPWFNDRCVMMCGDRFGRLTGYDSDALHANIMVGFPRALITFQAQHEVLFMLDDVLQELLKGVEPSGSEEWSTLISKGLHSAGVDASWNSYIHEPFTTPVEYSPEDIFQKSVERLKMVQDELVLLQTDPAYAQEMIRLRKVAFGNAIPGFQREETYKCISHFLMLEMVERFEMWHTVSSRCRELVEAMSRYGGSWSPGSILPPEVAMHSSALKASIQNWQRVSSLSFDMQMPNTNLAHRQMSSTNFSFESYYNDTDEVVDPHNQFDRLKWYITVIRKSVWQNESSERIRADIFEIIEREEDTFKFMDQPTREHINDMMVLDEIQARVIWAQQIERSAIAFPWMESDEGCCVLGDPQCPHSELKFQPGAGTRIGNLTLSLMDASWPKGRKDLSWLAKATLSRERLAQLWQAIFAEYDAARKAGVKTAACGTSLGTFMTEATSDPAFLARLAEERELCEAESRKLSLAAEEKARALTGYVAQTQWGPDNEEKLKLQCDTKKAKATAKNKPLQSAHDLADGLCSLQIKSDHSSSCCHDSALVLDKKASTSPPVVLLVKNESLVVFQKMYRADTVFTQGGTIRWQAFVQAMKDAGFAAEEASGSAVSFRSSIGGSICFHRPHPDPVLHPIMLYAMARRLTKWFGFTTESFVLRETEAAT